MKNDFHSFLCSNLTIDVDIIALVFKTSICAACCSIAEIKESSRTIVSSVEIGNNSGCSITIRLILSLIV